MLSLTLLNASCVPWGGGTRVFYIATTIYAPCFTPLIHPTPLYIHMHIHTVCIHTFALRVLSVCILTLESKNKMRTNIYIRLENEEAWHALENKSEWVNERLGKTEYSSNLDIKLPIITEKNKDMQFCKHNAVIGFCKKGCK